ncbi:hypothetical protein L9F63_018416, partial [Diploptera punctata]
RRRYEETASIAFSATILATSSGPVHPDPQQCISNPRFIVLKYLHGCSLLPHEKSAFISI